MLSNKLASAIASLEGYVSPDGGEGVPEDAGVPFADIVTDDLPETIQEHVEALESAVASLEQIQLARGYITDGMSRERFAALQRVAGNVPALEQFFATHTAEMYTQEVTTIGLTQSQESLLGAIGKGATWLMEQIRKLVALISRLFSEYIWRPTAADDKNTKVIEDSAHTAERHTNILFKQSSYKGTVPHMKAKELDDAYKSKVNGFWNALCDAHVKRRNLYTLTQGIYVSLVQTLREYNSVLSKVTDLEPAIITTTLSTLVNKDTQYEIREFIYAIEGRDLVVPDKIVPSVKLLKEVVDKALETKAEFKEDLVGYHGTLTMRSPSLRTLISDMQFAHRTFEAIMRNIQRRNDLEPESLVMIGDLMRTIVTQIDVATRTRRLHSLMLREAASYMKRRSETVRKSATAPGVPKELSNELLK